MRLPNGYGSVVKQSGKRRKPYVVRKSEIKEFCIIEADPKTLGIASSSRFSARYGGWAIECTPENKRALKSHSVPYRTEFKQAFRDVGYFETSKEAYTYLALLNNGNIPDDQKRYTNVPTFSEVFYKWHEWRDSFKTPMKESTWQCYRVAFNRFSKIHNKKLPSITVSEYQEIINSVSHMSKSSIADMSKVLHAVYKYAIANDITDKDVSQYVKLEWTSNEEKIHVPFTDDEIDTLWKNKDDRNVKILLIYIYTGMRPIELIQMKRNNVHLDEHYMVGGVKTEAGIDRVIPIADKVYVFVEEFYREGNEYLVSTKNGKEYKPQALRRETCKVLERMGMHHLPHDTRHTFVTKMNLTGVPEPIIKRIVGHSLAGNVTQDVYTHLPVEKLLEYVNLL